MGGEPTYDPLVGAVRRAAGRAGGGMPGALRPPPPGQALVLIPDDGALATVWPGQPLPAVPPGGYQAVLTLDVDEHLLVLPVQLPSAEPGAVFHRRVALLCRVADPALVVGHGIRDVGSVVYGPVRDALSAVARRYGPAQAAEADAAMEAVLRDVAGDAAVRVRDARLEGGPAGPGAGAGRTPEATGEGAGRVLRGEVMARRDGDPEGGRAGDGHGSGHGSGAGGERRKVSRVRGSGLGGAVPSGGSGAGAGAGASAGAVGGPGPGSAAPADGVRRSRVRGARRGGSSGDGNGKGAGA
jgi:hypothetical protein